MINYYIFTKKYYATWLDIPAERLDDKEITLINTAKRKICPIGHSRNLELYCAAFDDSLFISFSPELDGEIGFDKHFQGLSVADGIAKLNELFREKLIRRKAHYFTQLPDTVDLSKAVALKKDNFNDYLLFYTTHYPSITPDGWLYDYFIKMAERNRCYGVYENGILVCATDAPDIPYMADIITEPGINTLADYRQRGYALAACAKYLEYALRQNEVPIWTCGHSNTASYKLAEKLGFKWFCDLYTVEGQDNGL